MKNFFEKTRGDSLENFMAGYVLCYYLPRSGLKLISILELAKMRIVWQNKSVGWATIKEFEYCQYNPFWSLPQDSTFS